MLTAFKKGVKGGLIVIIPEESGDVLCANTTFRTAGPEVDRKRRQSCENKADLNKTFQHKSINFTPWIKLLCNLLSEHKELSINTLTLSSVRSSYSDGGGGGNILSWQLTLSILLHNP